MTRVMFVGEMYYPDLQVGGGPMPGGPGVQPPLGIWGPPQMPPGIWPSPPGSRPPSGPVDPGYSPPWATPGLGRPVDPGYSPPWAQAPVDPGYSPPWARPQPPGIWGGPWLPPYVDNTLPRPPGAPPYPDHALPPFATNLPVIPPQQPQPVPGDPNKAYLVAYVPKSDGSGHERITFTVEYPLPAEPPTEATPKA